MSVLLPPCELGSPGILRVFPQPESRCEPIEPPGTPAAFPAFDKSFQLATGWKLAWKTGLASHDAGRPEELLPASEINLKVRGTAEFDRLEIDDLSRLLPPGIPATSRIYCENMVLRLNQLMQELTHEVTEKRDCAYADVPVIDPSGIPNRLQPCFLDQFCIVPLRIPENDETGDSAELGGCQWLIHPSGSISAAVFAVSGTTALRPAGLMAAQSSFLTAARLESECQEIHDQIRLGINQMFCGDVNVQSVVWSLDPLMGQASICGDEPFSISLDREQLEFDSETQASFPWYRNQLLLAVHQRPDRSMPDDSVQWRDIALTHLAGHDPHQWQSTLGPRLDEHIPSVTAIPDLAVAMTRI